MSSQTKSNKMVRSRNPKVNNKQKKILLQFLSDYPAVYCHKVTTDFTHEDHILFWQKVACALNLFGPPIKTPEIWKKAWKDMRLRYRKAGIDTKEILRSMKTEKVVNTKALVENSERLKTLKGSQRDQLLRKCGVHESALENDMLAEYTLNTYQKTNAKDFKVDISKTREVALELGISSLEKKLRSESDGELETDPLKDGISDDYEELYLDVEEIVKSEDESTNDLPILFDDSTTEMNVDKSKILQSDFENEDDKNTISEEKITEVISCIPETTKSTSSKNSNGDTNTILSNVLMELRKHNSLQKEKLIMQKNFIDHQKSLLQCTLNVQKEMAKAQIALANTVKSFVNNISFNS